MPRWRVRTIVVVIAGVALTVVVAIVPSVGFAFMSPVLRAVLETIVTLVGGFVAFLFVGRYRRHGRTADLAMAAALGMLALDYPLFVALPETDPSGRIEDIGKWVYLVVTACAAGLFWWASGQDPSSTHSESASYRVGADSLNKFAPMYAAAAAALSSFVLLVFFGFDPDARVTGHQPSLFAVPGVSAVRLICFLLFIGGAYRFSSARFSRDDHLIGWMSVGITFLALGNLEYGLFPPVVHNELHLGDVFRLAGFLVFAVGATAEIHAYWYESRQLARLEERREVARELHDGVAQELAFLRTHAGAAVGPALDVGWLGQLQAAADRALAESRRAIAALVADQPLTLRGDLEETLREIGLGSGVALELDVRPCKIDGVSREVLTRIVREAVINAVRHGRPSSISVLFDGDECPLLRVVDDGVGFDVAEADRRSHGFGLVSMRERARSIGAQLAIRSLPGHGTTVEVSWMSSANPSAS